MLDEKIDKIEQMVSQIHVALVGNEYTKNKGLVDAVHQNTKFRRKSGWLGGAIAGISFGFAWLKDWIFH